MAKPNTNQQQQRQGGKPVMRTFLNIEDMLDTNKVNIIKTAVSEILFDMINKKGGAKKMVALHQIFNYIREEGVMISFLTIRFGLSKLIEDKTIRYFKNDRSFVYYGFSEKGWNEMNQLQRNA